jgi:LysR family transcriptional regulator, transcriptional activator of the cysJI operon
MESVYLKTLVEVVKTGSLSRAADVLCVTQPAVSRRIKFLEDQYGRPLLDRSGPRLRPTEAGMLVYRKAETLLEIEDELVAGLHRLGGKTKISFGSSPAFGIAHLPAVLREFMLACGDTADLSFVLQTPEQVRDGLEEGLFDVAVVEMCECFDLSAYRSFPLPEDEMIIVTAPGLNVPSPETTVDALLDIPLFTRKEGCCSRTLLENNLKRVGRDIQEFRRIIVCDDLHMVVQAVLQGDAVSFLSRDILAGHLEAGRLKAHHVPGFQHTRSRALVLGRPDTPDGPLGRFVATLFAHFSLPVPEELRAAGESAELAAVGGTGCRARCESSPVAPRRAAPPAVRAGKLRKAGRSAAR